MGLDKVSRWCSVLAVDGVCLFDIRCKAVVCVRGRSEECCLRGRKERGKKGTLWAMTASRPSQHCSRRTEPSLHHPTPQDHLADRPPTFINKDQDTSRRRTALELQPIYTLRSSSSTNDCFSNSSLDPPPSSHTSRQEEASPANLSRSCRDSGLGHPIRSSSRIQHVRVMMRL